MPTIKTHVILLLIVFLQCVKIGAQDTPQTYISFKTEEIITVDGLAHETAWQNASWSSEFIDIEGAIKPTYKTQVKMLWDDEYLHFYAEMEEPHVWGTLKQRDTVIFYNNDFEIFINPDGNTHDYMEFEMNVLNTIWDLYLTKPYRNNGNILDYWNMEGLKSAVHINGTLNNPSDTDKGWSIEVSIPWKVMAEGYKGTVPPKDDFWRINFSRVNWQFDLENNKYSRKRKLDGSFEPEYNWVWSPQYVINMHEPERWGYVYFTTDKAPNQTFTIPNDEHIKWYMYELYRKVFSSKDTIENQTFSSVIKGKPIQVQVIKEVTGFVLVSTSPFTGKKLTIDTDGKFKTQE